MAVTDNTYTGNGSTTLYSFTFPYLEETDIKVSLNGVVTTAYTLANATTVSFNTAPANGAAIRIYRDTNVDALAATFFAGSAIRAQDLNEDFLQSNYTVQEIKDRYMDAQNPSVSGNLDMNGYRITDLGTATAGTDAVNKTYVDAYINTVYQGPLAADPATRTGGGALQEGDLYFNTVEDILKAWTGTEWVISAAAGNIVRWRKTAVGGETSLSGNDDNAQPLSYVVGNEQVFLNGALQQRGVDYTAATGTSIDGLVALTAGDVVELHAVQGYVSATIADGSVGTIKIADGAVTSAKIADGAVTSAKIADGAIVDADVNSSAGIVATKLSFTQAGTGAVQRTVESKLQDTVSVKDFGAKGDFTDDCTPALLAALQYVDSIGGGTVFVPSGTYKVGTQLDLTAVGALTNVTIKGASKFDSIFKLADNYNGSADRWIFDFTNIHNGFSIESIGFDGNEANMGAAEVVRDKIIKIKCNDFAIRDCYFFNEAGRGIVTVLGDRIFIQDNTFKDIGARTGASTWASDSSSIHPGNADSPSNYVVVTGNVSTNVINDANQHSFIDAIIGEGAVFTNNISYGDNQGLLLTTRNGNTNNVTIAHNSFNVKSRAIYVYTNPGSGSASGSFTNVDISNNTINASTCILVDGGALGAGNGGGKLFRDSKISNNVLGNATFGSAAGSYHIRLRYALRCLISGNLSNNAVVTSFLVDNSEHIVVSDNTSNFSNGHGLEIDSINYATISSNTILNSSQTTNNTSSSIKITSPCTFVDINNNRLGASSPSLAKRPKSGIAGQDTAAITNINICNNIIRHAATSSIEDSFASVVNMVITDNVGFNDTPATPPTITSAQSGYQGGRHADIWRLSSDASRTIQGIQAGGARWDGKTISIVNVGTNDIVMAHESGGATTASYRMINYSGANVTLAANQTIKYMYDTTSSRWRQIA